MLRSLLLVVALLALPAAARPVRVCLIGDSITDGFAPATTSWGKYLLNLNSGDFGVNNLAESGIKIEVAVSNTSATDRFNRGVARGNCTHVVFLIGTNDLPPGTTDAVMWLGSGGSTGLKVLCDRTVAMGAKCILCALLPRGSGASISAALEITRRAFNARLAAYANGSTIIYVDTDTPLREVQGALVNSGSVTAWAPSTAYSVGNVRQNDGRRYIVATAGTSAASGGPTGTGTAIADGTVVWTNNPALLGGTSDGLHPPDAQQLLIAQTVQAAAGGW
jgi:hypothetical protein